MQSRRCVVLRKKRSMIIKSLSLRDFRNHEQVQFQSFSPHINVFLGKNGVGKTNLLEAIGVLATGRSFRTAKDSVMIKTGSPRAYLKLTYAGAADHAIEVLLDQQKPKSIRLSGENIRRMSELYACLPTVLFSPEDLKTVKEGPSFRRKYLDFDICRLRPAYLDTLKKYQQLLAQKNAALKAGAEDTLIGVYNEQLSEQIFQIERTRLHYAAELSRTATRALKSMGKTDAVEISLTSPFITQSGVAEQQEIFAVLQNALARERFEKTSVLGAHRDDVAFYLNGRDARLYASQGEARTLMLSLKFAAVKLIRDVLQTDPVLMLDDVFSDLDALRQKWVLKNARDLQTFLTLAEDRIELGEEDKVFLLTEEGIFERKTRTE